MRFYYTDSVDLVAVFFCAVIVPIIPNGIPFRIGHKGDAGRISFKITTGINIHLGHFITGIDRARSNEQLTAFWPCFIVDGVP